MVTHSKKYRDAVKGEIKMLKEKKQLLQEQEEYLRYDYVTSKLSELGLNDNRENDPDFKKALREVYEESSKEIAKAFKSVQRDVEKTIKDRLLIILQDENQNRDMPITRLYQDGTDIYVEDFTPYANEDYMSKELLSNLKNGITLNSKLREELAQFVVEEAVQV